MCKNKKPISGFTLLELVITIAIAGILMAMAIPSFNAMMRNNRLTTYANEMVTSLNLARSEAIKRGVNVSVRKLSAAGTGTYWSNSGWNVFVDIDGDGTLDAPGSTEITGNGSVTVEDTNGNGLLDAGEDSNGNGVLDGDYILRSSPALPAAFTLAGNGNVLRDRITYQSDGTINNTPGSFAVCDNSDGNNLPEPFTSRLIIVNSVGRVRMGKDANNDGIPEKDDKSALTSCTSP
jgi:type IV fimbrial biogenesis protein FimT